MLHDDCHIHASSCGVASLHVPKPAHTVPVTVLPLEYPSVAPMKCDVEIATDKTFKDDAEIPTEVEPTKGFGGGVLDNGGFYNILQLEKPRPRVEPCVKAGFVATGISCTFCPFATKRPTSSKASFNFWVKPLQEMELALTEKLRQLQWRGYGQLQAGTNARRSWQWCACRKLILRQPSHKMRWQQAVEPHAVQEGFPTVQKSK
eukprot:4041903-Amphidinium_carterae.2